MCLYARVFMCVCARHRKHAMQVSSNNPPKKPKKTEGCTSLKEKVWRGRVGRCIAARARWSAKWKGYDQTNRGNSTSPNDVCECVFVCMCVRVCVCSCVRVSTVQCSECNVLTCNVNISKKRSYPAMALVERCAPWIYSDRYKDVSENVQRCFNSSSKCNNVSHT